MRSRLLNIVETFWMIFKPLSQAHFLKTYIYTHMVYSSFWLVSFFFPYYGLEKKVFIVQGTFSSSAPPARRPFFLPVKEILYQHVWHFQRDFYFYAKWAVKCARVVAGLYCLVVYFVYYIVLAWFNFYTLYNRKKILNGIGHFWWFLYTVAEKEKLIMRKVDLD